MSFNQFHLKNGDGSGDWYQIYPHHGEFIEDFRVDQTHKKTLGGQTNSFKLIGEAFRYTLPLSFVDSSTENQIVDWWRNQTEIAFTINISGTAETVYCKIINKRYPFSKRMHGQWHLREGVLFLHSVRDNIDTSGVLANFTLDHAVKGKLDTATNVLTDGSGLNALPNIRSKGKTAGVP